MENTHSSDANHLSIKQYLKIGALLTIITVVELIASYIALGALLVPILLILSAIKFVIVVAYFMHLRFEHRLLSQIFAFAFVLALCILLAVVALFIYDPSISNR